MRVGINLISAFILASCAFAQPQPKCSDFQVYDIVSSATDYSTYERVKDVTCSEEIKNSEDAKSAGIKAGIPLPVLDDVFQLSFGASASSSSFENWKKSFCSSHYSDIETKLSTAQLSKTFSDNAAKILDDCLKSQEPVFGYFTPSKSADGFTFQMRVLGKDALKGAHIEPPDTISNCDPTNPFGLKGFNKFLTDLDISGQNKGFTCAWKNTKSLRLTVRLKNQGDHVFELPPILSRPVAITSVPQAESLAQYMMRGGRVALKFDGKDNPSAAWEQNNQVYTVWYDPGGKRWWATGKIRNGGYREGVDGATTCPQSAKLEGAHPVSICYSPLSNIVVLWQGGYQFDNDGILYGGSDEIYGHMTKLDK